MTEFHIQLKKAMDLRNMNQNTLCEKTKIPKSAMSQYVAGSFKPKQKRTYLIAEALNVNEAWLMGFDNLPMERTTEPIDNIEIERSLDDKIEIGNRIRQCREQAEITLEELGNKIGFNKSTIQRYESGKVERIKTPILQAIAKELDVDPLYLALKTDKKGTFEGITSNISDIYTDGIYKIPVFETVSAGFGAYASSDIIDYIPIFVKNPNEVPDLMGIRVSGDSMYPKIEDGDIIVVRKQTSVDSGSIAVLLLDGDEGLVKKVEYGKGWIDLISINPEYKTRHFEGAELLRIQVVGLVKQVIKML